MALVYVATAAALLIVLWPLVFIVSSSFSSSYAVVSGRVWLWPVEFTLDGYKGVFNYPRIWTGFRNSIWYAGFGTLISVVITIMAAYALSRKDMKGRPFVIFLFVFTMLFSGGLIPTYLLVRDLGMIDTWLALIVPGAVSVWNVIIARTFFQVTIPDELLEASRMDGSNDFGFFLRIVVPLSAPIVAVLALFYAVGYWNQYFAALIYLRNPQLFPLQLVLREVLIQNEFDASMMGNVKEIAQRETMRNLLKYSLIVIASLPVILIYPFVQKHFVKGVMIGSLKG